MVRALHEMGALRVRVADVEIVFGAPGLTQDDRELEAERERDRRKQEQEDDLYRSGG